MSEQKEVPMNADSMKHATDSIPKSSQGSLEVTGLGLIACLIIAFWSLVGDGTLPISQYLVFVAFLVVSAGGLVWRILKLAPTRRAKSGEPQQPGV